MDQTLEIQNLKAELEKVHSQFNIFYKLTKVMRTTLHLEEAAFIILTGLTAHHGLGFNRAFLFLADNKNKTLKGFMGIGPVDGSEAQKIWNLIEVKKMDLYGLIYNYHGIKEGAVNSPLMKLTRSISMSLDSQSELVHDIIHSQSPFVITEGMIKQRYSNDQIIGKLNLFNFAAASLASSTGFAGMILVDNLVTGKTITEEDIHIFSMFIDQAAGAIENCKEYEYTLTRASTDTLTGLWNHGSFQWHLGEKIAKSSKENEPLSILMADIDHFKKFNDSFGHQLGDEALKLIAHTFKSSARDKDIACRYGGEEFALIMPCTNPETARAIAERIRNAVEQVSLNEHSFSISIGVSSFPQDTHTKHELLRKADMALYRAKREGRNRVISA